MSLVSQTNKKLKTLSLSLYNSHTHEFALESRENVAINFSRLLESGEISAVDLITHSNVI